MSKVELGNNKNVILAGLRKKYNRAKREVDLLTKLWHETETPEVAEQLFSAEQKLSAAAAKLSKLRSTK